MEALVVSEYDEWVVEKLVSPFSNYNGYGMKFPNIRKIFDKGDKKVY